MFRPQVDFSDWRPYSYGFWAPSDAYGWVWVSSEPYGWATYHYGRWYYDEFQGWVWIPGAEWGPAWVAWEQTDDYVGWAPLGPGGSWNQFRTANAPGGPFARAECPIACVHIVAPSGGQHQPKSCSFVAQLPPG